MNLGFLTRYEGAQLLLDLDVLRKVTDEKYVELLSDRVPVNESIEEIKFAEGKRKTKFLYYQIRGTWFSFAWDGREKSLIASEEIYKGSWRFIVGHMPCSA